MAHYAGFVPRSEQHCASTHRGMRLQQAKSLAQRGHEGKNSASCFRIPAQKGASQLAESSAIHYAGHRPSAPGEEGMAAGEGEQWADPETGLIFHQGSRGWANAASPLLSSSDRAAGEIGSAAGVGLRGSAARGGVALGPARQRRVGGGGGGGDDSGTRG